MNSKLTIEEIVLINNLLYCENLGGPKGTFLHPSQQAKTIGDYVRGVLRNSADIEDDTEYSTGVTGAEYKEILQAVKANEHLCEIIIQEVHYEGANVGGGRSAFLIDPVYNEAIVAFKGTQSDAEWIDNVSGLYTVPTAFQENALNWYRSLDLDGYEAITVTGHSKGGNKAKYITIMDDSVDNCFSFDGQGFSDEFIRKYSAEIVRNREKIINIIAESDFVNILLNDVGPKQFYLGTNFGRLGFAENHCANAILFFDDKGDMYLWKAKAQDKKMADLDKMLNSFIRTCRMSTKENIANMLGNVIVSAKAGDTEGLIATFTDERYKDSAASLAAYILRYKEEKPEMVASVREILGQNGFNTGMLGIIDFITNHEFLLEMIGKNPNAMIKLLKMNHAPEPAIVFLSSHFGLFSFIVLVSKKMHMLKDINLQGDDIDPEDEVITIGQKRRFYVSKRTALITAAGIIAAIVIISIILAIIL